ncbi:MAG: type II secretion system inner membrane protein GspF [Betaproteobacteria bacterium]
MAAFRFEAVDGFGKTARGIVEADTVRLARSKLRDMQLTPLNVEALQDNQAVAANGSISLRGLISSYELSLLTRQLSTLLNAGLNIEQSLAAIAEQMEKPLIREVLLGVRAGVVAGSALSLAMAAYPTIFPEIYRALIHAGEESGELSKVLERLATYTESRHAMKQKVIAALIYPALVTLTAILVVGSLLIYVVPQVVGVFQQSKQALPLLTQIMIFISDFLRHTWLYLIALLAGGIWVFKQSLKNEAACYRWHQFLLKIPMLGKLLRSLSTARLASTLAILVGSGVPLILSLNAAAKIVSLLPMQAAIKEAINVVHDGGALSRTLRDSGQFPPILIHLIANAEATGQLGKMLESAAIQQENEVNNKLTILTSVLEPLLILAMGGMVLLIVLAVMLPIIEINQLVH